MGQTIAFSGLLGWAFRPRNFMKNPPRRINREHRANRRGGFSTLSTWPVAAAIRRKPGTDTKFPAQFAGNWLSVPGFAPRETLRPAIVPPSAFPSTAQCPTIATMHRVCLSLFLAAAAFSQTTIVNPGFEEGELGSVPAGWFLPPGF